MLLKSSNSLSRRLDELVNFLTEYALQYYITWLFYLKREYK